MERMNREIRFRAWNKRIGWKNRDGTECEPKMEYDSFIIYPSTGLCEFPQGGWDLSGYTEKGMILMQYTGLKDKNGKEVYEGDIVIPNTIDEPCIVEYSESMGRYIGIRDIGTFTDLQNIREVLGNIFENSDLLPTPSTDESN